MTDPAPDRAGRVERLDLRGVAPFVRFGTASDRYAGWIGQIYPETYSTRTKKRSRKLGGASWEERTLPIDSVVHYFEHFEVLELDFTFYRPLLEPDGTAGSNWQVLRQYADHAPDGALFLLKAPQAFFARRLRRGRGEYVANESFLDAEACISRFLEPARALLGARLLGVIFEQEYQRKGDSPTPADNVAELEGFFGSLPEDLQYHLELRSPHLLAEPYFDWLAARGLGFVFSHWTWLPPIREQWKRCGERFTASDGTAVARLLTPLRMKYADAYALAHPFDRPVDELSGSSQAQNMVLDAAALALQGAVQDAIVAIITNNRAWGNAPALAQTIALRILREQTRRRDPSPT